VDFGLFCRIYAVKGKEISIFLHRFELENMSIYEILPALDLTQSVHAKISIGMHWVVKFKISIIPLIGLETRLG
jgi:hypothetical protein